MATKVVVAGATGNLGGQISRELGRRGAEVSALVRPGSERAKVAKLEQDGAGIVEVDWQDAAGLSRACEGADCVVSALSGLREVIVDLQSRLLEAAIAAGVPRLVPSDYAVDFTRLPEGSNRNLDLRREFHRRLDRAAIGSTSILNGAFGDLLASGRMLLLDLEGRKVNYYGEADQKLDFTTTGNTAEFTAAAALDREAPAILRIAGDQISPRELAQTASEVRQARFELVRLGSVEEFGEQIARERAADPAGENSVFPRWQAKQYLHNMFSGQAKLEPLDNDRYPGIEWTGVREIIGGGQQAGK